MTDDDVKRLMKRCQVGVGGRNALNDAHDIMAECYGTLGRLMMERDAAMALIAAHNAECERLCHRDTKGGRCEAYVSRGRECTDCPRDWMIDDSRALLGDGRDAP